MNRKKIILLLLALLAAIGIGAYAVRLIFFAETPESQIRKTFTLLSQTIQKTGKEGLLIEMEKAKTASNFFDDFCTLKLENIPNGTGVMSRENIKTNTYLLRKYFRTMKISFYDLEIAVEKNGQEAAATFTAVFDGNSDSARSVKETKELDAGLVKKDGKWLFRSLAFRDIIRK